MAAKTSGSAFYTMWRMAMRGSGPCVYLGVMVRLGLPRPELRMDDGERPTPSAAAGGAGISSPGVRAGGYITDHEGWCRGDGPLILLG